MKSSARCLSLTSDKLIYLSLHHPKKKQMSLMRKCRSVSLTSCVMSSSFCVEFLSAIFPIYFFWACVFTLHFKLCGSLMLLVFSVIDQ